MKTFLLAVDGSEGARRAALFVAEWAESASAKVELIYVYDRPTAIHLGLGASDEHKLSEIGESISRGAIDGASKIVGSRARLDRHLAIGDPAEEIVRRGRDIGADLIVLGASGLRAPHGALLGSIAQRVLQLAGRPVLIVP